VTFNALSASCPSRRALERIGDKWTALVVRALSRAERRRFAELRREVEGISQKMLTQTLRSLERDGLVTRTVHAEVPPRVEYALTPLGRTLIEPLDAVTRWAESHVPAIEQAQAAYDGR